MSDTPIRVVVVDDQALMRTGFRMILESAGIEVAAEAENGREALDVVRRHRPDVVLMDIRMPELDGVAATEQLMADPSVEARILILTTFDLDEYVFAALQAGAAGFLLKDTPPEALIEAVRVIATGDALLAPSITKRLIGEFAKHAGTGVPTDLPGLSSQCKTSEASYKTERGPCRCFELASRHMQNRSKTHSGLQIGGLRSVVAAEAKRFAPTTSKKVE